MSDLKHLYDNNGVFVDNSSELNDYLRDDVSFDWVATEDALYVGLYKPFNQLFLELTTAAQLGGSLTFEYFDGSAFVEVPVVDDTKDLSRSGFFRWEKPSDWSETSIDGESQFYLKITYSVDDTFTLRGLNIVFADDNDLTAVARNIDRFRAKGDTSFIAYHLGARDEIVQSIRNSGNAKQRSNEDFIRNFTKWDFLDASEIRQAAKFLCLALIFDDASDNIDDKSYQRSRDYKADFGEAFRLFFRSLDKNDDGKKDPEEILTRRVIRNLKV